MKLKALDKINKLKKIINTLIIDDVFNRCGYNIEAIHAEMISREIDEDTLGFWIWLINENKEVYSPNFRKSLGYKDEKDFPNVPDSWMNAISENDKEKALSKFDEHVESLGAIEYLVPCTYKKKNGEKINLICQGKVVHWDKNKKPLLMIGLHFK